MQAAFGLISKTDVDQKEVHLVVVVFVAAYLVPVGHSVPCVTHAVD